MESIKLLETIFKNNLSFSKNNLINEKYNENYESFLFNLNDFTFRHRLAKKTSKKDGYFVTHYTKDNNGKNRPFIVDENKYKLVITILDDKNIGQFIFPRDILISKHILTTIKHPGKMAFRVYPSWVENLNKTALNSQRWQLDYFIDLSNSIDIDQLYKHYLK